MVGRVGELRRGRRALLRRERGGHADPEQPHASCRFTNALVRRPPPDPEPGEPGAPTPPTTRPPTLTPSDPGTPGRRGQDTGGPVHPDRARRHESRARQHLGGPQGAHPPPAHLREERQRVTATVTVSNHGLATPRESFWTTRPLRRPG
jgi:hypothetical protein